jgi:hypothetical protein
MDLGVVGTRFCTEELAVVSVSIWILGMLELEPLDKGLPQCLQCLAES